MSHTTNVPPADRPEPASAAAAPEGSLIERLAVSKQAAGCLVTALPLVGLLLTLLVGLPVFAALLCGCLLLAVAVICQQALVACTSPRLRLLVSARLVLLLVVAALLFCISGSLWMATVSALLLWLSSDRLLGPRTLLELRLRLRSPR
jgi:hypothetical protein